EGTLHEMKKSIWIWCLLAAGLFFLWNCNNNQETSSVPTSSSNSPWLNINDTVDYVGMTKCAMCHDTIRHTFVHTGMGQSFDTASFGKSAANYQHPIIYDKKLNFYYQAFKSNGSIYMREFRLEGRDTVHQRVEKIDYIVGSGQHTNSHLTSVNGYLYQMPMTFYTQQKKWDLPPGFENGNNSRFSRILNSECISCHNSLPEMDRGSENKFTLMPKGISCERCHGPGELHVHEKLKGIRVDTKKDTDFTIVNPKKLSFDLQVNLCQRCHLQGNAVLKPGKTFFDFRPGMQLSEVMSVFLPRYENDPSFIMASHADRMTQSKCFTKSGKLTCITCHNPHVSVKVTGKQIFNDACNSCHSNSNQHLCTKAGITAQSNCVSCHMPRSGTKDIPHVTVHDHFIRKPEPPKKVAGEKRFIGLASINEKNPSALTMAKAYGQFYERFDNGNSKHLDSAFFYLQRCKSKDLEYWRTSIYLHFMKGNFSEVLESGNRLGLGNWDAWTAYRMGETQHEMGMLSEAVGSLKMAVKLQPRNLEFQNKLAAYLMESQDFASAKKTLEWIIQENPKEVQAWNNLGFLHLQSGNGAKADECYRKALALDPDYEPLLMNWAGYCLYQGNVREAKKIVGRIIQRNPQNQQAKAILEQLKS
ncbi:MAG: tetratricopeptide repeat protein, partial [Bacteroidia bacterium]